MSIQQNVDRELGGCCCVVCVPSATGGILQSLGKFKSVLPPGLHTINCCTDNVNVISLQIQMIEMTVVSLTHDSTTVHVVSQIMFRVIPSMLQVSYFSAQSPFTLIQKSLESAVRASLKDHNFGELFGIKGELAATARQAVQKSLAQYGYEIVDVLFLDFQPTTAVRQAMMSSALQRYNRIAQKLRSDIQCIEAVALAEAQSEAKRLSGVGEAEMQKGVSVGTGSAMTLWKGGNKSAEVMALVLLEQYVGMLDAVSHAKGTDTTFIAGGLERNGVITHRTI